MGVVQSTTREYPRYKNWRDERKIGKVPPMHMPICFGRVKKVPKKGKAATSKAATQRKRRKRIPKTSDPESKNSKSKQITVNYDCDVDEYDLLVMGTAAAGKDEANLECVSSPRLPSVEAPQSIAADDKVGGCDNDDITISLTDDGSEDEGENDRPLIEQPSVSGDCLICNGRIRSGEDFALRCIQPRCRLVCHIECLAERCLEPGQYVPIEGSCPICDSHFLWGDLIRKANGCSDIVQDANNTGLFEVDDVSDCEGD